MFMICARRGLLAPKIPTSTAIYVTKRRKQNSVTLNPQNRSFLFTTLCLCTICFKVGNGLSEVQL